MQFVYEQAQSKMFGRFKFIQIMTPMYKQKNSNENDVKLILNQANHSDFSKNNLQGVLEEYACMPLNRLLYCCCKESI